MLFIGHIPELIKLDQQKEEIVARCAVPIQQLRDLMESLSKAYKGTDQRTSYPASVAYRHWKRLATTEIRNVGSIAGNLFLARKGFPSDLFIVLATLEAKVTIATKAGSSPMTTVDYTMMDFLKGDNILDGTSIIYEIKIPYQPRENVFMDSYKVSQRPQNSHPLVNAGFSMKVTASNFEEVKIFFGKIDDKGPQEMTTTEKWMIGNCTPANLYNEKLSGLFDVLRKELNGIATENIKYSKSFRVDTACNIFFKYLVKMAATFQLPHWKDVKNVSLKKLACSNGH